MRSMFAMLTVSAMCWAASGDSHAAPPDGGADAERADAERGDADRTDGDARRDEPRIDEPKTDKHDVERPAAARPNAKTDKNPNDADPKKAAGGALAERRAAAARQKVADAAKRLYPRFDANRDKVLDDAEWTRAKAAIDKMVDAEVLKTSGNRRELVRQALAGMQRPDVQRNGTDVATEAAEQYARDLFAAAAEVAENAQPMVVPVPPPQAGRRGNSDNGEDPNNRGRFDRRLPRGNATDAERAREEALRRRGLREEGGKIVPIAPGRQGGNPQGGNRQPDGQRPNPPRGARP